MKPERIEELARRVNRRPWDDLADVERGKALRIARTLYAAAMRDAAGVAKTVFPPFVSGEDATDRGLKLGTRAVAAALETIAKETDNGN